MSPLRVLRGFVFGALGGVFGWMLVEFLPFGLPFQPARFEHPGMVPPQVTPQVEALLGLALGLAIGGFLGLAEGMEEGTMSRFRRAFAAFIVLGPLGGYLGLYFGQIVFGKLGGQVDSAHISVGEFLPQLLIRGLGWSLIGLFLGAVFGVPNMSPRRMWNGAIGGLIGGFLGGVVFQLMAFTGIFQGLQARLVGFTAIGGAIGFFINLIAEALKRVWVKVLIGRNEGREHVIDTPLAYVGRDELAEVPVFLDPMVPKRMASFRATGGRYALYPESAALPIQVNGQPLTPGTVLRDGDAIQFGRVTLGFYEKSTATGTARPVDRVALADFSSAQVVPGATPLPENPNVCAFCGQMRDPATGACACTVPAGAVPAGDYGYPAPPGYGPGPGYAPQGAPGAGDAYGYPAQDPAYGATMMDATQVTPYAPAGGGPRLVALDGPHAGQSFPLGAGEAGIGREPSQQIALSGDTTASRRHARLIATQAGWVVRDEGSANGTWVNGVRVQEQPLFPGDVVRVGQTSLRFEA